MSGGEGHAVEISRLAVEIRAEAADPLAGDEIPITFVITNLGSASYSYDDRSGDLSGRMDEFRLTVHDELGAPLPDPRTVARVPRGYVGGGLFRQAELQPGQSFSKTIELNLWAHVWEPGLYTVRGFYRFEYGASVESPPIRVRVRPRGDEEMERYIEELTARLGRAGNAEARSRWVRRLMYTGDWRAAAPLLELREQGDGTALWIVEAFASYLPADEALLQQAVEATRRLGLSTSSLGVLEQLGATRETLEALIGESLAAPDAGRRLEAALGAQRYPADRFAPRLIEIASRAGEGREQAIRALALHRTPDGVKALASLRRDSDSATLEVVEAAILAAYCGSGSGFGRPLRADDFPDLAERPRCGDG